MERKMMLAKQVSAIKNFIAHHGTQAKHTQVLELVAKLNGAKFWNQLKEIKPYESNTALISEGDTDYRIRPGYQSVWVAAGNISVYILKTPESVKVELYPDGGEFGTFGDKAEFSYQNSKLAGAADFSLADEKDVKKAKPTVNLYEKACHQLLTAYAANEDGTGEISWEALDAAFATAKQATGENWYNRLVAEVRADNN